MRNLHLLFHGRFPSEKAASLFAAKSAEAFAEEKTRVFLVVPKRKAALASDPFTYYGVRENFSIVYLPVIDLFHTALPKRLSFLLSFASFSAMSWFYLFKQSFMGQLTSKDLVYSNEWMPLVFARTISQNLFYEMHDFPESGLRIFGFFIRRMKWVLIHNRWKAEKAAKMFHVNPERILCRMNAVETSQFDIPLEKAEARKQLGLPEGKRIVVYTGHLYGWKGVETLAHAAALLGDQYLTIFVGGTDSDVYKFRATHLGSFDAKTNIAGTLMAVGHRPHAEMPVWQKAADVLVLPNTAKEDISKYYTSPMKLFEYMASKRPIVASRIPSIEEVVSDGEALLVTPDDAQAFAQGIVQVWEDPNKAKELARSAFEKVRENTWKNRAREILSFAELED